MHFDVYAIEDDGSLTKINDTPVPAESLGVLVSRLTEIPMLFRLVTT
jgi:hypothetical protein